MIGFGIFGSCLLIGGFLIWLMTCWWSEHSSIIFYHRAWDKKLAGLISASAIIQHTAHTIRFADYPHDIWITNYPYDCGHPHRVGLENLKPSYFTRRKLRKLYEKTRGGIS